MSYNRWKPSQDELYHFGVLGMKWGAHKANSYVSKGKIEKQKVTLQQIDAKASRKLERINARYEKKQAKADRQFDKAERKANRLFTSKRAAEKAFRKASKAQFKANKVAVRGKKWYDQMQKSYKKAGMNMSEKNRKIGEELVRQVRANSRAMYAASYATGR